MTSNEKNEGEGSTMTAADLAQPGAAQVNEAAVESRKAKRTQLDAPKGTATWSVLPEEVCVAGVDYPADLSDPFYDERVNLPLDLGMIDDIDENGVKQPVTLVKDGEVAKVTDGRRRVLHARAANKRREGRGEPALRILAFLDKGDAEQVFLTSRRSNAYAVVDGTMQRARNAERALTRFGSTPEKVAKAENVKVRVVKEWIAILQLCPESHKAIEQGLIAPRSALELLADVPRKDQAKTLAGELEKAGGKKITREAAEVAAKTRKTERTPALPADTGEGSKPKSEPSIAPKVKVLRKLMLAASMEDNKVKLFGETGKNTPRTDAFMLAIRWVRGDITTKGVTGLTAVMRELGL